MSSASDNNPCISTITTKQNQEFSTSSNSVFQCLESLGIYQTVYNQKVAEENLSEDEIRAIQNDRPSLTDPDVFDTKYPQESMNIAREFHRSISTGLDDALDCSNLSPRKKSSRNDTSESGQLVLCQPSSFLINLIKIYEQKNDSNDDDSDNFKESLINQKWSQLSQKFPHNRPIMNFILQQHNLENLMAAMIVALRKVSCRCYALKALDWHLKNVTQPIALHDLIWSFVSAVTNSVDLEKLETEDYININYFDKKDFYENDVHYQANLGISRHPASDLNIAGEAIKPLQEMFHSILQTISNLMLLLPMGSPLQQIAIRSFCLYFDSSDHSFLHRCHVFSNISKILSRSEEDPLSFSVLEDSSQTSSSLSVIIQQFQDITSHLEIKASSRQAMVDCLIDNSTETFWESGDEDKSKIKLISILNTNPDIQMNIVYIHVDNYRNPGNKVSSVTFKCSEILNNDQQFFKLKTIEIDNHFSGWIYGPLPVNNCFKIIRLEFKGPDHNLRLRQIKIMGQDLSNLKDQIKEVKDCSHLQQLNCETETLRVFRLLTSQVSKTKIQINIQ